jgi:hypothetical protein
MSSNAALVNLIADLLSGGGRSLSVVSLSMGNIPGLVLSPIIAKDDVDALKIKVTESGGRLSNDFGSDTLLGLCGKHGATKCFPVLVEAFKGRVDLKTEFKKSTNGNPLLQALINHQFPMADYLMATYKADIDLANLQAFHVKGAKPCLLVLANLNQDVPMWFWLLKNNYPVDRLTRIGNQAFSLIDVVLADEKNSLFWSHTLVGKYTGRISYPVSTKIKQALLAMGFKPEQFVQPLTKEEEVLAHYMHPEYKAELDKRVADFYESLREAFICTCKKCTAAKEQETKVDAATKVDVATPAPSPELIVEKELPPLEEIPPLEAIQQSTHVSMAEISASKDELLADKLAETLH